MRVFIITVLFFILATSAWSLDAEFDAQLNAGPADLEELVIEEALKAVASPAAYLADHSMDDFDNKRLNRLREEKGEGFANQVYATWIETKSFGASCPELIGNCDYYLCREKLNPCGVKGYHLAFGYQYCKKSFDDLSNRVSPKGQKWLSEVATCLQQSMEDNISTEVECSVIKKQSIKSHEKCYKDTNFCGQRFSDVLKVIGMLSPELAKPRMISLGLTIIKNCVL